MEAESQPDLVGDLLAAASSRTAGLAFGGVRVHLNDLWRSGPLPFCRNAIEGRYPIRRGSGNAIRIDDFSRFFGYNQIMESFFNEHLRQYVDTSRKPWRTRRAGNVPMQISAAALTDVRCWRMRPGFFRPARIFFRRKDLPEIIESAREVRKIWPPPSPIEPSMIIIFSLRLKMF